MRSPSMLKISDAASLALHTMVLLAANPGRLVSNREIATVLNVSEAHLSKVLQRLAKVGLVSSIRGPKGGFRLGKSGEGITLLEVYEAIEGPLVTCNCLLNNPICSKKKCILGNLVENINVQVIEYLSKTSIDSIADVYNKSV